MDQIEESNQSDLIRQRGGFPEEWGLRLEGISGFIPGGSIHVFSEWDRGENIRNLGLNTRTDDNCW